MITITISQNVYVFLYLNTYLCRVRLIDFGWLTYVCGRVSAGLDRRTSLNFRRFHTPEVQHSSPTLHEATLVLTIHHDTCQRDVMHTGTEEPVSSIASVVRLLITDPEITSRAM